MTDAPRDAGLYGPGSVTWKVVGHPGAIIGGLRALIVQSFHPLAMAGVANHSDYTRRPLDRLTRTAYYVAATCFGDTETAKAAAQRVKRMHRKVVGVDQVTGRPYSAADPEIQLWVHCVEVHSYLAAYRVFGGGLTADQQDQYLAESARRAALLEVDPADVPATVEQLRDYWESMRETLLVSQATRDTLNFVTRPQPRGELMAVFPALVVLANAAVAITPGYLRRLGGIDRPRAIDAAAITAARPALGALRLPFVRDLPARLYGRETHALGKAARARMAA
jgi:uncharacterized protein (DUF2236 family)